MPRAFTGKTHISTVEHHRKNGDVYIYRRTTQYDRETKKTKTIKMELLGKKDPATGEIVKTRARRTKEEMELIRASRKHIGMTEILEWMGKSSGIDDDLTSVMRGLAPKVISVARYLASSGHGTIAGFENWQLTHPVPTDDFINESDCHKLFELLGKNEEYSQGYFINRASHLSEHDSVAFDSTTISTHSVNQIEARQGFNKDGDDLNTIKLLTLYSVENHQPIAFAKEPGNIPDVISIENAIKQLDVLNLKRPQLITDSGYYSEANLLTLLRTHTDFITSCPSTKINWIRQALDPELVKLNSCMSVCPFDELQIHGITIPVKHEFTWKRQRSSNNLAKGEDESKEYRLYLHVYRSASKEQIDSVNDFRRISELKEQILSGITEFSDAAQRFIDKYLIIKRRGNKINVALNATNMDERAKYYGLFVLISNHEKDCFDVLSKYRKRERIEEFFKLDKEYVDGYRHRVWNCDTLKGRMLVQFIALGYLSFMYTKIKELKEQLGKPNGDPIHDRQDNLKKEKKLLSWLDNQSLHNQLTWFDCTEETTVKTDAGTRRWRTEITSRDRLYLQSLGVIK